MRLTGFGIAGAITSIAVAITMIQSSRPPSPSRSMDESAANATARPASGDPRPPARRNAPKVEPAAPTSRRASHDDAPPDSPRSTLSTQSVSGRVVDAFGLAIEGATVHRVDVVAPELAAAFGTFITTTDEEGRWSLRIEDDDSVSLAAVKFGFASVTRPLVSLAKLPRGVFPDFVLGDGVTITGHIVDPDGAPIEGVLVTADSGSYDCGPLIEDGVAFPARALMSRSQDGAITTADGRYAIEGLAPGTRYRVAAFAEGWLFVSKPPDSLDSWVAAPTEDVDFTLTRAAGLRLHVFNRRTGDPVRRYFIFAIVDDQIMKFQRVNSAKEPEGYALWLLPGNYDLEIRASGCGTVAEKDLHLEVGTPGELTVYLTPKTEIESGTLRVSAQRSNGTTVDFVSLLAAHDAEAFQRTRDIRRFPYGHGQISSLETGSYEVLAWSPDPFDQWVCFPAGIRAGETTTVDVVFRRGGTITLDVTGPDGQRVSEGTAELRSREGAAISLRTGLPRCDGASFQARTSKVWLHSAPLEPGAYDVTLTCSGFEPRTVPIEVSAGEDTLVRVALRRTP